MPQLRGLRVSFPKADIEPPKGWIANAAASGLYAQDIRALKPHAEACMTAITTKSGQMRFDSCVLTLPKWAKIQEKREKCACAPRLVAPPEIDDLAVDTAVMVENVHESAQAPQNTTLLGKYRSTFSY